MLTFDSRTHITSIARPGCFEQANGGTLFLTEMPIALQPKLLGILEEAKVRRLGGSTEIRFNVRVIAAPNRDPAEAIAEGRLREDLFYRFNVFDLVVPFGTHVSEAERQVILKTLEHVGQNKTEAARRL